MPATLYATVLKYDTEARQSDTIDERKQVISNALQKANDFIEKKIAAGSDKRRQVWGLFAAPEYTFANVLNHDNHGVGDVRHMDEGSKVGIEAWLKGLSADYPHLLLFPGSIAWKKPLQRDFAAYAQNKRAAGSKLSDTELRKKFDAKDMTRTEKARAAVRQNANDFQQGDLDRQVAGPMGNHSFRGWKPNPGKTCDADAWLFETDDPSGTLAGGKRWTTDASKAATNFTQTHAAPSNREKLVQLGGGTVTHMGRNTCLVYLNGRKVAKYNKAQDYHEVLDNSGATVYVPGKSVPTFDVEGVKYGVEICLDHAYGSLSDRLPSTAKPNVNVVLSAKVKLDANNLPDKAAMVVHACSNVSWSLVGTGGVDGTNAKLEADETTFRIYSFSV